MKLRRRPRCTTLQPEQFARYLLALIHVVRALVPEEDIKPWLWTP
jgi:hypothetical protein